ncbi:uL13 family ribosomal protein, partial [Mycobacterium kansasii]
DKRHYRHSGFPGGLSSRTISEVLGSKNPERVVQKAVLGMIPKNKLGSAIGGKLKVYAGPNHPHTAQQPVPYEIKQVAQQ